MIPAGSLNSPQILLLSGLGPTADLTALGIDTVVDLPYVGSNLQDHALLTSNWEVNATFTWDDVNRNTTLLGELVAEWEANKTGIVSAGATLQIGWLRIPDNDTIFETYEDPSAGPTSAHYELVFVVSFFYFAYKRPWLVTKSYVVSRTTSSVPRPVRRPTTLPL